MLVETAARHFSGQNGLMLLTIDESRIDGDLRWEPSRGGALFPHLYGSMPTDVVVAELRLPDGVPADESIAEALGEQ